MTTRADDRRWWCEPGDDDDAATTSDDDVDSFLWLPFVAAVCSYRLWQLMWLPIWRPMWLPMWLQPPGALTVAAAPHMPSQSLQPPKCPHSPCSPPSAPDGPWALTPDPRGWVRRHGATTTRQRRQRGDDDATTTTTTTTRQRPQMSPPKYRHPKCRHRNVATIRHPNVATDEDDDDDDATTTTRRRRDDDGCPHSRRSPHSRCSHPGALTPDPRG